MKVSGSKAIQLVLISAVMVLLAAQCGQEVPVRALTDARAEIAGAERISAETHSPKEYKDARDALFAAHRFLADEKFGDAAKKADMARDLALAAREKSSGPHSDGQAAKTESALKDADEAYAEVLAKDDFQAAKKLLADGKQILSDAKATPNEKGASIEDRRARLRKFEAADMKFAAAQKAALSAKNVALAQKDDLLDSLSGVEALLRRAETYKAPTLVPEQYNAAKSEASLARREINAGKLKKGNGHILKAEEKARAALNAVLERYAAEKKKEATEAVAAAKKEYEGGNFGAVTDPKLKERVTRVQETLTAASESLGSADKNYAAKKYERSIKDSEEALRLAKILKEQIAALQQQVAVRSRGGVKSGKWAKWKRYVVQKKRPVDCLWRIAGTKGHYNNPWLWRKIYQANKKQIKDPNLIYPGQVLWIPPRNYRGRAFPAVPPDTKMPPKKTDKKGKKESPTQPRETIQ